MAEQSDLPEIRLRPKKSPKRFRHGAAWVFADELVLDRRTRAIAAGSVVRLLDPDKRPFAIAAFNPESKIAGRILSLDAEEKIETDWFRTKILLAAQMRDVLYAEPYYRLIHAEADGLPGLIIDRFGPIFVVQANSAWADASLDRIVDVLKGDLSAEVIFKNSSGRARGLEGLDDVSGVLFGDVPDPVPVPMNGAVYRADIAGGQKTGLYFDQRENHAFAARLSQGRDVLDVFSHVGGFSLAALAAGARSALAVDASAPALDLAQRGAQDSGVADRFSVRQGDAFAVMQDLIEAERTFDVVVCDPPAFAPRREALSAGLRGYEKVALHAAKLVSPGGYLVLCSCSGAVPVRDFRTASVTGIGRTGRKAQLLHTGQAGPDHPTHVQLDETAYLKALFFRLML